MASHIPRVHYNPPIEQITIPNKNIQSYFMKNECSYLVKEEEIFPDYKNEDDQIITVFITQSDIIIGTNIEDCTVLTKDKSKYESFENEETLKNSQMHESLKSSQSVFDSNFVPSKLIEDKEFFENMFYLGNFNKKNLSSIFHFQSVLERKLRELFIFKNSFVSLVFDDLFNRTEIICLIDLFTKFLRCKGVLITPLSLVSCFGMNLSSASVIINNNDYVSICFIEDNCFVDNTYVLKHKNSSKKEIFFDVQNEDFIEDFSKQGFNIGTRSFLCKFCDLKIDSILNINNHLKEKHGNEINDENEETFGEYFTEIQEEKAKIKFYDVVDNFKTLLSFNFDAEKARKIGGNVILIGFNEDFDFQKNFDFEIKVKNDFYGFSLLRGAFAFVNLECVKEMWLTDKEWEIGGIRILKEKLLFYI
ncbi:hypothetical protein GVAV_003414 [Gurleya vavrai]